MKPVMTKGNMTLGEFIRALKECQPQETIFFDFCGFSPGELDSYRGFYEDLAFKPEQKAVNVGIVLSNCENAIEKTYQGYKGGDYTMGEWTDLWVAPYGQATSTAVVGVKRLNWGAVVIETAYID